MTFKFMYRLHFCWRKNRGHSLLFICYLLICSFAIGTPRAEADTNKLQASLNSFTAKLPSQSALIVAEIPGGKVLFSHNSHAPLKPASILKILTSYVALKRLGPSYRFQTSVVGSRIVNAKVETVAIRGAGDPSFTIQELFLLVRRLKLLGIQEIGSVLLDDSSFLDAQKRSGDRAYEAGSSALAFNFNSIRLQVCPTVVGQPALVVSDPYEFPVKLSGSIKSVAANVREYVLDEIEVNAYHLSGRTGVQLGCFDHYRAVVDPLHYLAKVLAYQLANHGIKVGRIARGSFDKAMGWEFGMQSRELKAIITDLNHLSSNFIAEQILFALGADKADKQGKFSRQQGLKNIYNDLHNLVAGLAPNEFNIVDASGLSHDNRVSVRLILAALVEFWKNQGLRVEFEGSLPVQGQSGTLRTRPIIEQLVVRAKTGSLDGTSSLAGYIYPKVGPVLAIVLIQNSTGARDAFIKMENELLNLIAKNL